MSHKYRAAIGRESPRPASRGIIAYPKPRRRNCRRAISLAASTWVGNSAFCRLLCANKRRWLPGIRQKGAVDSSADIPDMRVCGAITFLTITHGCRAAVPFGQSPKRHQKRFLIPRHQTDDAVTGGDVSRIARNSHRKRRAALSVFDGADSVGRKPVSPHAGEGRKAGVYVDIKLKIKHRNLCKEISVPYLYL